MTKHAIRCGPDQVTAEFTTRCGLKSLRLSGGVYDHFIVAGKEVDVDCPKCKIRLTRIEKQILKLVADHYKRVRMVVFREGNQRFGWRLGQNLDIYVRRRQHHGLWKKGLLTGSLRYNVMPTPAGASLASKLPSVEEDF